MAWDLRIDHFQVIDSYVATAHNPRPLAKRMGAVGMISG
jgi:hypothetical protein